MELTNSAVHDRGDADYSCRICLETAERSEVIAPCACKGTSKWVHRGCLNHWRSTREDIAFSKCTECLQSYELTSRADDSCQPRMMRRGKFFLLVVRDSCGAFLFTQLVIVSLSYLIYAFDRKTSRLLIYFHSGAHAQLFYYSCGLTIFLATIGMLYFCVGTANDFRTDCSGCCYRSTDMMCFECCGKTIKTMYLRCTISTSKHDYMRSNFIMLRISYMFAWLSILIESNM